jgi:hypothetical protein
MTKYEFEPPSEMAQTSLGSGLRWVAPMCERCITPMLAAVAVGRRARGRGISLSSLTAGQTRFNRARSVTVEERVRLWARKQGEVPRDGVLAVGGRHR